MSDLSFYIISDELNCFEIGLNLKMILRILFRDFLVNDFHLLSIYILEVSFL
jgi:hypothetical protein